MAENPGPNGGLLFHGVRYWIDPYRISAQLERSAEPAGFRRGLLQGALMPMAMPNLVVGKDIVIYAQRNTGVPYKLGYTAGVNGAGLVFFGLFFWRVSRIRREVQTRP